MKRFEHPEANQGDESSAKRRKVGKDQNRLQAEDAQRQETRGEGAAAQHRVHDFVRTNEPGSHEPSRERGVRQEMPQPLVSLVAQFRERRPKDGFSAGGDMWTTSYVQRLTSGVQASLERLPLGKEPATRDRDTGKTSAPQFRLHEWSLGVVKGKDLEGYAREMKEVTVRVTWTEIVNAKLKAHWDELGGNYNYTDAWTDGWNKVLTDEEKQGYNQERAIQDEQDRMQPQAEYTTLSQQPYNTGFSQDSTTPYSSGYGDSSTAYSRGYGDSSTAYSRDAHMSANQPPADKPRSVATANGFFDANSDFYFKDMMRYGNDAYLAAHKKGKINEFRDDKKYRAYLAFKAWQDTIKPEYRAQHNFSSHEKRMQYVEYARYTGVENVMKNKGSNKTYKSKDDLLVSINKVRKNENKEPLDMKSFEQGAEWHAEEVVDYARHVGVEKVTKVNGSKETYKSKAELLANINKIRKNENKEPLDTKGLDQEVDYFSFEKLVQENND